MGAEPLNNPQAAAFPAIPGYRIEALIGRGATGTVYRATQLAVDRKVALKVLHAELATRGRAVRRLQREARTTAKLAHPGIVTAIDMGQTNGLWWYAMELIDGPSLAERLKKQGAMNEREAVRVFIPLCEALEHAFDQGVVHRDIKPSNILIDSTGRARLVDLGLAFADDDPMLTAQGGTLGTPHYISPEQARNPQAADVKSDIWSLGATLFHCLCGRPPFAGESVAEIMSGVLYARVPDPLSLAPELSKGMSLVLRKCLTRDPVRRYQHPRELREDLERIRERRAVSVKRGSLDPVAGGWSARQKAAWTAAATLLALTLALVLWKPWRAPSAQPENADLVAPLEPLERIAQKLRGDKVLLASGLADIEALRLQITPQHERRYREVYDQFNARYDAAASELRRKFQQDLQRALDARDFVEARRLVDSELVQRLQAELNPNARQLDELERRFGLAQLQLQVAADARAALAALEQRLKDYYREVNERTAQADAERGDWRKARAALSIDVATLIERSGAVTRGLPSADVNALTDTLRRWLIEDAVSDLDERWIALDQRLAQSLTQRAAELAAALDARRLSHAADELRQHWEDELARARLTREQMLDSVAATALATLGARAAELEAIERANDARDAQELFEEKRAALAPLWARREYDRLASDWAAAKQLAYFEPVIAQIEIELAEAELLESVLQRAAASLIELARTRAQVRLVVGTIERVGVLECGPDPLRDGLRLMPADGLAPPELLALRPLHGDKATLLTRAEIELRAGLSPTSESAVDRLALALLRWREGDSTAAAAVVPGPPERAELRPLALDLVRRLDRDGSVRRHAESQRLEYAKRQYELLNRRSRERTHASVVADSVAKIDELLDHYGDLAFIDKHSAELRQLKGELLQPRAPVSEADFIAAFGPSQLQLDYSTHAVRLHFDFQPTYAGKWSRGEWVDVGQGWQARAKHARDDLADARLWPRLALPPPLDLEAALSLELSIEQPAESGPPQLFALSVAGVHVVFAGSNEPGKPGRYKIGSGGPEDFERLLGALDVGGQAFDGLQRDQRYTLKVELSQGRGAVVVYLDGKQLDAESTLRPDPERDTDTDCIVLRSIEPVRVLEATLKGRYR